MTFCSAFHDWKSVDVALRVRAGKSSSRHESCRGSCSVRHGNRGFRGYRASVWCKLAVGLRAVFSLALAESAGAADTSIAVRATQAARDARAAIEAKDFSAAVTNLEGAVELRPDMPQLRLDLAEAQVGAGQLDEAIATLKGYATLGFHTAVEKAEAFAPLRARKDFEQVTKEIGANAQTKGRGEMAFTLRDVTGLIEGIAWREKTDQFFFSDVHHRAIWTRDKDGALKRFTPEGDELLGVFGLAIDEANGVLWAATSAVPAMRGYTPEMIGQGAIAEIDLDSGAIRRAISLPHTAGSEAPHVLGDIALAADGSVIATDSGMPIVWRLPPGGNALQRFGDSSEVFNLQGVAALPSGAVALADQINGLLRMDLPRGNIARLEPPAGTSLIAIKGLAVAPDGKLLALQTDLRPNRVLSIELDPSGDSIVGVTVLESGHIAMGAPSLGCIGPEGDFYFIGNAGWSRFADGDAQPTPPRQVPIFRTKLPKPPTKR